MAMTSFREFHLGELVKEKGVDEAHDIILDALQKKELDANSFSIRRAYLQCGGTLDTLEDSGAKGFILESSAGVPSSMFPIITGEVLAQKMIDTYDLDIKPVEPLYETVPTRMKDARLAGFTAQEGLKSVTESKEYDASGFGEKYVQIATTKYGRILPITAEAIYFDQTGQLLSYAAKFGQMAAYKKAELILKGVIDNDSVVYRPSGTASALYASGYSNLNTSAGTINTTNLNTAMLAFDNQTDENGNYVNVLGNRQLILMYKPDVHATVTTLLNSEHLPGSTNNDVNIYYKNFIPFKNPYISAATTWFLGDFKRQFVWNENWPIQVMAAKPGSDYEFSRDITFALKVRLMGGIGAIDYRFVQKQTA